MFLAIPAVDLKNRKCVQLKQGREDRVLLEIEKPLEIAKLWERAGAPRLHVVDLDGAIRGVRSNENILKDMVKELEIPIQFGGGIRTVEDARNLLDLGVEKIILGTMALESTDKLKLIVEKYGRERLIVALDSKKGEVVIRGWKERTGVLAKKIIKKFEPYTNEILFTNVDVEGLMNGIDTSAIEEVIKSSSLDIIVSGGISSIDDIKEVRSLGAKGVVIGSAIYTGTLRYKDALLASHEA